MEFVKLGNGGRLNSAIYHKLIHSIVSYAATVFFFSAFLYARAHTHTVFILV